MRKSLCLFLLMGCLSACASIAADKQVYRGKLVLTGNAPFEEPVLVDPQGARWRLEGIDKPRAEQLQNRHIEVEADAPAIPMGPFKVLKVKRLKMLD